MQLRVYVQGGEGGDDENKFDEFMGSDAGVFAGGQYDEDDKEADQIWESIDNFMDERRRVSEGGGVGVGDGDGVRGGQGRMDGFWLSVMCV
jgi:pre-mRNA-processing factor 6